MSFNEEEELRVDFFFSSEANHSITPIHTAKKMEERMTITLTPDIENALVDQASKQGTTPEQLALESLRERFVASVDEGNPTDGAKTLADYLADHIGVIHSSEHVPGGARMSEDTGKKFAEGMVEKRRRGKL